VFALWEKRLETYLIMTGYGLRCKGNAWPKNQSGVLVDVNSQCYDSHWVPSLERATISS